jgi:hypothetical protein
MGDEFTKESARSLKQIYERWRPSFAGWQLTSNRRQLIDSTLGIVELPALPHGDFCRCAFCRPSNDDE